MIITSQQLSNGNMKRGQCIQENN